MRFKVGRFTLIAYAGWLLEILLLRRHPTGKLWLFRRFGYSKKQQELRLGPVTIGWGDYKWMA